MQGRSPDRPDLADKVVCLLDLAVHSVRHSLLTFSVEKSSRFPVGKLLLLVDIILLNVVVKPANLKLIASFYPHPSAFG